LSIGLIARNSRRAVSAMTHPDAPVLDPELPQQQPHLVDIARAQEAIA
jgi:hypothetical protein